MHLKRAIVTLFLTCHMRSFNIISFRSHFPGFTPFHSCSLSTSLIRSYLLSQSFALPVIFSLSLSLSLSCFLILCLTLPCSLMPSYFLSPYHTLYFFHAIPFSLYLSCHAIPSFLWCCLPPSLSLMLSLSLSLFHIEFYGYLKNNFNQPFKNL